MNQDYQKQLQMREILPKEIIEQLDLPIDAYTIYVSGSIMEGYGNAESDLDVYIIFKEEIPLIDVDIQTQEKTISLKFTPRWRLDVESWALPHLISVAKQLQGCDPDNGVDCLRLPETDLIFAHNLRVGIPIYNVDNFETLRGNFDFKHLAQLLIGRYLFLYNNVAEDASGSLTTKQLGTALLTARDTVRLAIDAFNASNGETNIRSKWRFQKLEKIGNPEILQRYWDIEMGTQIHTKDDVIPFVEDCLMFANQLVVRAIRKN